SPRVDNPLNCAALPGEGPGTADDMARCARVEVCPTLSPSDPNYHDLRLYKSDPGIPAVQLAEAPASLLGLECPPYVPPGGLGLGKRRIVDLALENWHGVMTAISRLVMPRPLFGASAMSHNGLGGLTCCFSNIGWALSGLHLIRASARPTTLNIGGLEGTATVSVSNGTGEPASGLFVEGHILQGFGETAGGRLPGTSLQANVEPFTCASGPCTLPGINFCSNNPLYGTG